jgi:hypothetical protein
MSRRVGSDRAAENQQTIKNLLKLEGNKICADCKKNKRMLLLDSIELLPDTDDFQTQDGPVGTLESSSAFGAQASIEGWEPTSVE